MKPMLRVSERKNKTKNTKDIAFEKQRKLVKNIEVVVDRIKYIFEVVKEYNKKESDADEDDASSNKSATDDNVDVFTTAPSIDLFND